MEEQTKQVQDQAPDDARRRLLKAAAAAGGAVAAATLLPGGWSKPVALVGALPAHAQTSGVPIQLDSPTILGVSYVFDTGGSGPGLVCSELQGGLPIIGLNIQAQFWYTDPEGQVNEETGLHTKVRPGGCVQDKAVKKYGNPYFSNPVPEGIEYGGSLMFNMVTPCLSGNRLEWYLHTGDRGSDQILEASFVSPPIPI